MALSARELLLIIRARDMASRELSGVGGAIRQLGSDATTQGAKLMGMSQIMTSMGIGFAGAGAAGVAFFNETANAAAEFNTAAALTLTQTDGIGTNLEQLKDIAKEVAKEIPVPFEQMQTSLYDIFSSMDVDANGAYMLLREFSQAAVAGQVDLQTAARGTIGILNAFGLEASEVTRINDVMFQLVRKGVGTYEEFASAIGMATPAAVRSGQSIETLAGMMAFLTRNGLNTSAAAAAAGRALESMANSKTVARMEEMGVAVRDANGEFLPMVDIVRQLHDKLGNLPGPERVAILQELFKGSGGTIQARRFWDTAIQNFDEFNQRVGEMSKSAGAMDAAYKIMFDSPQMKIQELKNKYSVLATEIGDNVLPIKLRLAEVLLTVLDAWNNLSPGVQKAIVVFLGVASVVSLVVGAFLLIAGAITGFMALLSFAGITFGGFALAAGGVIAVLALIAGAAYLIYRNWDTIKPILLNFWEDVKTVALDVWDAIKPKVEQFVSFLHDAINNMRVAWNTWWPQIQATWDKIATKAQTAWAEVQQVVIRAVEVFKGIWATLGPALEEMNPFGFINEMIAKVWAAIEGIVPQVIGAFQNVASVVQMAVDVIIDAFKVGLDFVQGLWNVFGDSLINLLTSTWSGIATVIKGAFDIVAGLFKTFFSVINGDWSAAWEGLKQILSGAWQVIRGLFETGWATIKFVFEAGGAALRWLWDQLWAAIKAIASAAWDWLKETFQKGVDAIVGFFKDLPNKITFYLMALKEILSSKASEALEAMKSKVEEGGQKVLDWFKKLPATITAFLSGAGLWLFNIGRDIVQGLINGLGSMLSSLGNTVSNIANSVKDGVAGLLELNSPSKLMMRYGKWTVEGLIGGMNSMQGGVATAARSMVNPITAAPVTQFAGAAVSGGSGLTVAVAEGAVRLDFTGANTSTQADRETVQEMINEAFNRLVDQIVRDLG